MDNKIKITIQHYDEKNHIVFVEKQGKNIGTMLSLMQFEDDMEYWDMPTHIEDFTGNKGFVFSNDIDQELLLFEIQRFIDDHNLNERDCFID